MGQMKKASFIVPLLILFVVLSLCACESSSYNVPTNRSTTSNDSTQTMAVSGTTKPIKETPKINLLSASCDYVLCSGYDIDGNQYELVANQTETSRGFEITVGVIKNNAWIYSLSNDFPFLAEDGLFHVDVPMGGKSGSSLKQLNKIIEKLYFVDSGAFLIDCYKSNNSLSLYDHYYIVFSCDTLKSITINCSKTTLLYHYNKPKFLSGNVESYGHIYTDNGKLIMYSETSGTSSGWIEDQAFEWDIFDTKSLTSKTIANGIKGIRPRGILSEGVFFCTDRCFYDVNGQKAVDLSEYSINVWDDGDILFNNNTCAFKAKNSLGTQFLVTVDSTGRVISEEAA